MGAAYSTQVCSICVESQYTSEFKKTTANCDHASVCQQCVNRHIEAELNNKGNLRIPCLFDGCSNIMEYNDLKNLAKNDILERYDRFLVNQALGEESNFRWCKNARCGSGQIHWDGNNAPIMRCEACGEKSCYTHDVPWHTDLTCSQYDVVIRNKDKATQNLLAKETKACPKCGVRIMKHGGCNHMTCKISSCKYQFCWLCLADYDGILKNGNKFHKRTCQLYA